MSDNIKLIIEIPKEYKALFDTERCKSKFDSLATNEFGYVLRKAFQNGIPLDDVKAEIEQLRLHKAEFLTNDNKVCIDSQTVLEILDNIGKAESEVKPNDSKGT